MTSDSKKTVYSKAGQYPKGIPEAPNVRHLAVETEDHPYEYASFEGTIPKGQYGAGTVKIWDKGHYEPKLWENDKIEVHPKRGTAAWALCFGAA